MALRSLIDDQGLSNRFQFFLPSFVLGFPLDPVAGFLVALLLFPQFLLLAPLLLVTSSTDASSKGAKGKQEKNEDTQKEARKSFQEAKESLPEEKDNEKKKDKTDGEIEDICLLEMDEIMPKVLQPEKNVLTGHSAQSAPVAFSDHYN